MLLLGISEPKDQTAGAHLVWFAVYLETIVATQLRIASAAPAPGLSGVAACVLGKEVLPELQTRSNELIACRMVLTDRDYIWSKISVAGAISQQGEREV